MDGVEKSGVVHDGDHVFHALFSRCHGKDPNGSSHD
jgi:hypothetical protein